MGSLKHYRRNSLPSQVVLGRYGEDCVGPQGSLACASTTKALVLKVVHITECTREVLDLALTRASG
jgi:hypothetical protein